MLDSIAEKRKGPVVDFAAVPFLGSTAANAIARVAAKARRQGIRLFITGASPSGRRVPVDRGIIMRRQGFVRRRHGGVVEKVAWFGDQLG